MLHRLCSLALPLVAILVVGCQSTTPAVAPEPEMVQVTEAHREHVRRAQAAMELAAETPGREHANRLRRPEVATLMADILEQDEIAKSRLNQMLWDLKSSTKEAEKGVNFPMPPAANVPYTATPVVMDGKLDDPIWAQAVTYTGAYPFNTQTHKTDPATTFKIAWDDTYLYFAFDCADRDIIAPERARDDAVYADDCIEMFILPEFRSRAYWELIISPRRSIYDSIQTKDPNGWGSSHRTEETIAGLQIGIDLRGTIDDSSDTDSGYTVEVAVPFDQLPGYSRTGPAAGQTLRFMLVRLDVNTQADGKTKMIPYAHAPLMAWGHNIWNHATMTLVK